MRENNEDRYLVREGRNATLLAVADGVGGEAGGETASAAAIDALATGFFNASAGQAPADALAAAIRGANDAVLGAAGGNVGFAVHATRIAHKVSAPCRQAARRLCSLTIRSGFRRARNA